MSKNHWHPENVPEAIRRQSIEKVVTVKLDVDIVRMFGRYSSEVENGNSWVWSQCRGYRGELKDIFSCVLQSHPMKDFFFNPNYEKDKKRDFCQADIHQSKLFLQIRSLCCEPEFLELYLRMPFGFLSASSHRETSTIIGKKNNSCCKSTWTFWIQGGLPRVWLTSIKLTQMDETEDAEE